MPCDTPLKSHFMSVVIIPLLGSLVLKNFDSSELKPDWMSGNTLGKFTSKGKLKTCSGSAMEWISIIFVLQSNADDYNGDRLFFLSCSIFSVTPNVRLCTCKTKSPVKVLSW